ncbi:hypothetical protein [Caldimonas brevitalea]|uniref:Lipoprotein n=1 Tax=Caldimonas brevitalea TaxID=413882 RepID=A0A0G3BTX8_9BURK|nr:hypothetical protein [Caldimonas brevitalea]AKJ31488.1 hypothetical protein AAW51_4797 [Caldimonas brevitalea]
MFRKSIQALVCGVAIAGLSACGGGGGGGGDDNAGPSAATGDLTNTNYDGTTRSGAAAVSSSVKGPSVLTLAAGVTNAGGGGVDLSVRGVSQLMLQRLNPTRSAQAAATESGSIACPYGGSMTFTADVSGEEPRRGDKVTFTANDCKNGFDAPVVNGRVIATVLEATETKLSMRMAFEAFGPAGEALNGSVTYTASESNGSERIAFTFEGMAGAGAGADARMWYTLELSEDASTGKQTVSASGFVVVGSDAYKLQQDAAFTLSGGRPVSGKFRLIDKQGDYVELVAGTTAYTATFYAAGSTAPTAGPISIAYN